AVAGEEVAAQLAEGGAHAGGDGVGGDAGHARDLGGRAALDAREDEGLLALVVQAVDGLVEPLEVLGARELLIDDAVVGVGGNRRRRCAAAPSRTGSGGGRAGSSSRCARRCP